MAKKTKTKKLAHGKKAARGAGPAGGKMARWISAAVLSLALVVFIILPRWGQLLALLVVVLVAHHEWQKLARHTARPIVWFVVGFFYILASAVAAIYLLTLHPLWFLLTLMIVIAVDSGGYIVGRRWGRHLLAPALSPKKSWEGVLGGLVLAAVVLAVAMVLFPESVVGVRAAAMAGLVAVAAIGGDLFESCLKRQAGVKDSGGIIPGHGGVLDRIDGQLMGLLAAGLALAMGLG